MASTPTLVLMLVLMLATGCSKWDPAADRTPTSSTAPEPPAMHTSSREIDGTTFSISLGANALALDAARAAFDRIAFVTASLSDTDSVGEVSKLSDSAGIAPVVVSDALLRVVQTGTQVSIWSEGAFDMTTGVLDTFYNFTPQALRLPTPAELSGALPLISWKRVLVDAEQSTVFLDAQKMRLRTRGMRLGYSIDVAGEALRARGATNYRIVAGGVAQTRGTRGGQPWHLAIPHPRDSGVQLGTLSVHEASIASIGDFERVIQSPDGFRWHPTVDPTTGLPTNRAMLALVIAPNNAAAEAMATAALIMGPDKALAALPAWPDRAEALIVGADCRLHLTRGMVTMLHLNPAAVDAATLTVRNCADVAAPTPTPPEAAETTPTDQPAARTRGRDRRRTLASGGRFDCSQVVRANAQATLRRAQSQKSA